MKKEDGKKDRERIRIIINLLRGRRTFLLQEASHIESLLNFWESGKKHEKNQTNKS